MTTPNTNKPEIPFMRGMNFGFAAPRGWYGSEEGLAQIEKMRALNIEWVAPHVTYVQETYASTRVFMDFEFTPADEEVIAWCRAARSAGLKVILKPILEPLDGTWRGSIRPGDRVAAVFAGLADSVNNRTLWEKSFAASVAHYVELAARAEVECLCLGAEYQGAELFDDMWLRIIAEARQRYAGLLTYEFTPGNLRLRQSDLQAKQKNRVGDWWRELDFLGFSAYGNSKAGASLDELIAGFEEHKTRAARLSEEMGMPLALLETGHRSTRGLEGEAHDFESEGEYDPEVQSKYMEAVYRAFVDEPWFRGMFWWKWDEHQGHKRPNYYTDPAGDQGFTIDGKPAAETLKKLYA